MENEKIRFIINPKIVAAFLFFINLLFTIMVAILNFNKFKGLAIQFFLGCYQLLLALIFLFIISRQSSTYKLLIRYWGITGIWFIIAAVALNIEQHFIDKELMFITYMVILPMLIACYHVYITFKILSYFKNRQS